MDNDTATALATALATTVTEACATIGKAKTERIYRVEMAVCARYDMSAEDSMVRVVEALKFAIEIYNNFHAA